MAVSARRILIRWASFEDSQGILDCLHSAFRPYQQRYTVPAYSATVLTPATLRRRLRSMNVWVARTRNSRVVGTVAIKRISPGRAHLRGMAVLPEFQRRGIASRLLGAALRFARKEGYRQLTLETTEPLRTAERFYQSRGFSKTGRHRRWGGMKLVEFERRLRGSSKKGRKPTP